VWFSLSLLTRRPIVAVNESIDNQYGDGAKISRGVRNKKKIQKGYYPLNEENARTLLGKCRKSGRTNVTNTGRQSHRKVIRAPSRREKEKRRPVVLRPCCFDLGGNKVARQANPEWGSERVERWEQPPPDQSAAAAADVL